MKTLKIITSLSVVLLFLTFNSCKKNDDSTSSPLIGHWAESPSVEQFHYIFNANATGSFYIINCTTLKRSGDDSFNYTFDINSKSLIISYLDGYIETWSATLSGDELTLAHSDGKGGLNTFKLFRQ